MIQAGTLSNLETEPKAPPLFPGMKKFHFVGIGGIGMSALAKTLRHLGYEVSGSDRKENGTIQRMRTQGIQVFVGHENALGKSVSALVYSTAIQPDNPELLQAKRLGIPVLHRSQILAEFINKRASIGVTGTHGKTTTTAMISFLLSAAGLHPSCIVGGILLNAQDNVLLGSGDLYVAEVDESDKSQRHYFPLHSVITNMEPEHLDHYRDFDEIKACFRSYGNQTRPEGFLVINDDEAELKGLFADYKRPLVTYGFQHSADFWAHDIRLFPYSSQYRLYHREQCLGTVNLSVPGIHNISNSLAAFSLLLSLGLEPELLLPKITGFRGTGRRLEVKLETSKILVIDDYAHHPTEIRASLKALKNYGRMMTVIFQPHRFSRIKGLLKDFGPSFKDADRLIVTDIYGAGEENDQKVSPQEVLETVRASGHKNVSFIRREELLTMLQLTEAPQGDLFAFIGAGDIEEIANAFAVRFKS